MLVAHRFVGGLVSGLQKGAGAKKGRVSQTKEPGLQSGGCTGVEPCTHGWCL